MTIELITGRAGKAHVDSSDVRAFNAYVNASGRYVLHGGGATIESANDLRVLPAEILMDGAHVRITGTGEEVTLENGASSYDRIDIVALHYTSTGGDDSKVESVTLEVIKGTPVDTGGEAQDPAMPVPGTSILDGSSEVYVPYVRVKITGLVPGDPEEILPGREQMLRDMLVGLALSDVPGTLPISKGGTGATSAAAARTALGLGALATIGSPLPVANGGTGHSGGMTSRRNLGFWKQLWTGSLSAGASLTNSQFADYDVFLFDCQKDAVGVMVVVSSITSRVTLMSGTSGIYNGSVFNVLAYATRDEETRNRLTGVTCYFTPLNNGGNQTTGNVVAIYGLI